MLIVILAIIINISRPAFAEDFKGLKKKILQARETLLILLADKAKQNIDQQRAVKNTINEVSKALHEVQVPIGQENKMNELISTWRAFKKTREDEVIPALLSDKKEIAVKLAHGIQKQRLEKMLKILNELQAITVSLKIENEENGRKRFI